MTKKKTKNGKYREYFFFMSYLIEFLRVATENVNADADKKIPTILRSEKNP